MLKSVVTTPSQVASAATATVLVAENAARVGASVWNDATVNLYLLLANTGTVSATVCTVKLGPGDYFEAPYGYSGRITGIWASDDGGSARITEYF